MAESHVQTLTIANGAALSEAFNFSGYSWMQIQMPAAWTAASLGFQVSSALGGTYVPLYDASGNLVEVAVAVDQAFAVPSTITSASWVKLWSETGGSGVNQGAARTIIVVMGT